MSDPIMQDLANARTISRIESSRIDPPDFYEDDRCPGCRLSQFDCDHNLPGACMKCAVCKGAGDCRYNDCGCDEACFDCVDGQHTRRGNCVLSERSAIIAEELHLEEGMEDRRS